MPGIEEAQTLRIPKTILLTSIGILFAFIVFIVVHFSEIKQFGKLLEHAQPQWLLLAALCQVGTYFCAGAVWGTIVKEAGHTISFKNLARMSVEKLTVDQLVPTGGVSGNVVIYQVMRHMGLPDFVALEALIIDIFSHYLASACMVASALAVLWFSHGIPHVVQIVASVFSVIMVGIPSLIQYVVRNPHRKLPLWVSRFSPISQGVDVVRSVSHERLYSVKILVYSTVFTVGIYLLDTITLWAMMKVTGYGIGLLPAFAALVIAYISGVITLLPGGIGGFEAGCIFILTLYGVPIEAALTGTLLLRGFILWLPLVPGLVLVQKDVRVKF